jgi:hypothetical protein
MATVKNIPTKRSKKAEERVAMTRSSEMLVLDLSMAKQRD